MFNLNLTLIPSFHIQNTATITRRAKHAQQSIVTPLLRYHLLLAFGTNCPHSSMFNWFEHLSSGRTAFALYFQQNLATQDSGFSPTHLLSLVLPHRAIYKN